MLLQHTVHTSRKVERKCGGGDLFSSESLSLLIPSTLERGNAQEYYHLVQQLREKAILEASRTLEI